MTEKTLKEKELSNYRCNYHLYRVVSKSASHIGQ
jgi:hypothetical protein